MGRVLLGLGLIAIGAVVLGDRAGYWQADDVIGTWWPVAIIALGAAQLAERPRPWLGAGIVIAVGVILLLAQLGTFSVGIWEVFWPAVLIAVGVWLIVARLRARGPAVEGGVTANVFALFGEQNVSSNASEFARGSVAGIFGGAKLDLRDAALAPAGATIDAAGIFGGAELIVPRGWDIRISGVPVFGGIEDKTRHDGPSPEGAPRLTVSAFALFGGVEVKHDD